jgi:ArsR family transcriptional regulator
MIFAMDLLTTFRALADETRLRILLLLQHMDLAVGELADVLEQSQPRVSRHARILVEAGLVERRKEGSWVFLRLALQLALPGYADGAAADGLKMAAQGRDQALRKILSDSDFLDDALAQHVQADRAKLDAIRNQRAGRAADYFASHAEQWDAIRSLHQPEEMVEALLGEVLADVDIGRLLDVGTGTGRMVELFAQRAQHITAVDNSPEMLRLARAKLDNMGPDNIDIVQGDFYALPLGDDGFDTIIMHQVLHFADVPEAVLAETARVLKPGGILAIVDFASHDLEELRERDAHVRLGFADHQIHGAMAAAGLTLVESRALQGNPLTIKIWLGQLPKLPEASSLSTAPKMPIGEPNSPPKKQQKA